MTKQKIVIRFNAKCDKCRSKAMNIASNVEGVESVAIQGKDKNHLVVIGEDVDSVELTRSLRKKMGYAEIIGVYRMNAEVEESEELMCQCETQDDHGPKPMVYNEAYNTFPNSYNHYYPLPPQKMVYVYGSDHDSSPSICLIM